MPICDTPDIHIRTLYLLSFSSSQTVLPPQTPGLRNSSIGQPAIRGGCLSQSRLLNFSHPLHFSADCQVLMIWPLNCLLKPIASSPSPRLLTSLRPHHSPDGLWEQHSDRPLSSTELSLSHLTSHCQKRPSLRQIQPGHYPGSTPLSGLQTKSTA